MFLRRTNLLPRRLLVAISLCTAVLCGCASATPNPEEHKDDSSQALASALENDANSVLPTQQDIRGYKTFAYLMASPTVESFSATEWENTTSRVPATQKAEMIDDTSIAEQVNNQCSVYEQLGLGLVTTPGGNFQTVDGKRRRIALGQNGINQVTGYVSVFSTPSKAVASDLASAFQNNAAHCGQALQALYPNHKDDFFFQPVSAVDSDGTITLAGVYSGDTFMLKVHQMDNYLVTTWFRALNQGSSENLTDAINTIHHLALEKIARLTSEPH